MIILIYNFIQAKRLVPMNGLLKKIQIEEDKKINLKINFNHFTK